MTEIEAKFGRGCNEQHAEAERFHAAVTGDDEFIPCRICGREPIDPVAMRDNQYGLPALVCRSCYDKNYCSCGDRLVGGQCIRCKTEEWNRWYTKQNGFHGVNEYVNQERSRQSWGIGAGHYDGLD
jgi:hypothetical protein